MRGYKEGDLVYFRTKTIQVGIGRITYIHAPIAGTTDAVVQIESLRPVVKGPYVGATVRVLTTLSNCRIYKEPEYPR